MVNWNLDLIKFYLILPSKTNNCFNSFQILGIICMICASPAYTPATHWFLFVIVTSFIATLLWCFIYLLSIREALKLPINWILTVKKTIRKTALDDYNFYFIHIFIYILTKKYLITGNVEYIDIHRTLYDCFHRTVICLERIKSYIYIEKYCRRGKNLMTNLMIFYLIIC